MMTRYFLLIGLIILMVACTPTGPKGGPVETVRPSVTPTFMVEPTVFPTNTVEPTTIISPSPVETATILPTLPVPTPSAVPVVPTPSVEPTPWQAPQGSAFWYLDGDSIMRYDFSTGAAQTVIDNGGWEIESAAMSLFGGGWLAYVDHVGLNLLSFMGGTPVLLSENIGQWYVRGLLFSPDGRLLAYTDISGLHIYDLADGSDRVVWENDVEYMNEDPPDLTVHRAISWSTDQQWLTVWIGKWEGGWMDVGSLETGNLFELLGCYNTSWSPTETRLAMAVRYSGYLGCGGEIDGLYTVDMSQDGIDQQRIYAEEIPEDNYGWQGTAEVAWSPDGSQIVFVQDEFDGPKARLMLTTPDGSVVETLVDLAVGSIRTPVWSGDGRFIYYVENFPGNTDSGTVYAFEVATGEKRPIYTREDLLSIRELSPDESWMLVSAYNQFRNTNLRLVNIVDGTAVDIETETEEAWIGWQMP